MLRLLLRCASNIPWPLLALSGEGSIVTSKRMLVCAALTFAHGLLNYFDGRMSTRPRS